MKEQKKKVDRKSESAFGAQTPVQYILQQREKKRNIKPEREHKHKRKTCSQWKILSSLAHVRGKSRKVQ